MPDRIKLTLVLQEKNKNKAIQLQSRAFVLASNIFLESRILRDV